MHASYLRTTLGASMFLMPRPPAAIVSPTPPRLGPLIRLAGVPLARRCSCEPQIQAYTSRGKPRLFTHRASRNGKLWVWMSLCGPAVHERASVVMSTPGAISMPCCETSALPSPALGCVQRSRLMGRPEVAPAATTILGGWVLPVGGPQAQGAVNTPHRDERLAWLPQVVAEHRRVVAEGGRGRAPRARLRAARHGHPDRRRRGLLRGGWRLGGGRRRRLRGGVPVVSLCLCLFGSVSGHVSVSVHVSLSLSLALSFSLRLFLSLPPSLLPSLHLSVRTMDSRCHSGRPRHRRRPRRRSCQTPVVCWGRQGSHNTSTQAF